MFSWEFVDGSISGEKSYFFFFEYRKLYYLFMLKVDVVYLGFYFESILKKVIDFF